MSSFTTPLIVEFLGFRKWQLVESFEYYLTSETHYIITVPAGFVTDFASIPRIFWPILSPTGEYGKAAVIHDWLYVKRLGSRKWADEVFLEAMQVLGVPKWKRYPMYWAVRAFGSWQI